MNYFLDTNALWYLFESIVESQNLSLKSKLLNNDGVYSFAVSEITMLEIYSVLGSKARGRPEQSNIDCTRRIKNEAGELEECRQKWHQPGIRKLPQNLLQKFNKIINDMENGRGLLQAEIIKLESDIIEESRRLLVKHSSKNDFHSLDSLVAASMLKLAADRQWIIVTSDSKFTNILKLEGKSVYDPLKDTLNQYDPLFH